MNDSIKISTNIFCFTSTGEMEGTVTGARKIDGARIKDAPTQRFHF